MRLRAGFRRQPTGGYCAATLTVEVTSGNTAVDEVTLERLGLTWPPMMTRLTRLLRRGLEPYHSARPVRFLTLSRRAIVNCKWRRMAFRTSQIRTSAAAWHDTID